MNHAAGTVRERQQPLRERYQQTPSEARITDRGRTVAGTRTGPFHGFAVPGSQDYRIQWSFGVHSAVGGYDDGPNPGDLLCTALASCLDSTLRIIAERLGVKLLELGVDVAAEVDVRETLLYDRTVPVGFQRMRCQVSMEPVAGTDPALLDKLMAAAEHSCINLQTLRAGGPSRPQS